MDFLKPDATLLGTDKMAIQKLIVSRGDLCNFTGLGMTSIATLISQGVIKPRKDGKFDLQACVEKIIGYQGNKIRSRGTGAVGPDQSLTAARIAHAQAQTEGVTLKNAIARGDVIQLSVVDEVIDRLCAVIRERIMIYPSVAPRLLGLKEYEIEALLRSVSNEVIDDLANPATYGDWKQRTSEALGAPKAARAG
jgi:phage terminase Nu1 subunit (DNA packaging protein)